MSKGKILIVDPDFDVRNMLEIYFTGQGYEVMIAEDGARAVALMSPDEIPNVMLIEENLPDMKGAELVQKLRQLEYIDSMPPVLYLTQKDPHTTRNGIELGYDDYISKPFDIDELTQRIERAIRLGK